MNDKRKQRETLCISNAQRSLRAVAPAAAGASAADEGLHVVYGLVGEPLELACPAAVLGARELSAQQQQQLEQQQQAGSGAVSSP